MLFNLLQLFLRIFNKSSLHICDLLHEACFKLWNLTKKERKKRTTTLQLSLRVTR